MILSKPNNKSIDEKFKIIKKNLDRYSVDFLDKINLKYIVLCEDLYVSGIPAAGIPNYKMKTIIINIKFNKYNLERTIHHELFHIIMYNEDIDVNIDETVVMISVSDKLLFNSGSYRVSNKANSLLERLAAVINSEPAIEVMIEGHTDDRTVKQGSYIKDNWDLSTERATAIIRKLADDYNVAPEKMIAAGAGEIFFCA